ncbi:uncharacterized protein LOC109825267 isoform X2 [Asparagus officinalis]|nr:uncharacterized protein LOC109825267 isoform X2 [Asparagus officinalis]
MSPFTNTRALNRSSNKNGMNDGQEEYHAKAKKINWWFPVIYSTKWQPKCLMDLSKALHGFLVFEVAWKDVHGINYLNELQTDTSLALDVKSMRKWEFYSPEQASKCLSSWFSCNKSEIQSLRKSLRLLSDLNLHQPSAHSSSVLFQRPSPSDDDFLDVQESFTETGDKGEIQHEKICSCDEGSVIAPSQYSNTLILFRFSDCILPLKFKEIIMSDMRLLILLETGLPSWVIFFESYPFFCHFYRTWMRHLARTLYILISLVTVIFGFYDLYKNVPLLKATVARLSGPLFNWIEGWDMVTRLRYLGTMLFLQNIEKALKWFLMMSRSIATLLSAIIRPFSGPLGELMEFISPLWSACVEVAEMFFSTIWFILASMCNVLLDIAEFVLWPFEFCCSYLWSTVTLLYPLVSIIWDFILVPIRCVLTLADYMAVLLCNIFELFKDVWESIRGIFQTTGIFKTAALSGAKKGAYDISIWQGLWRDLFSQVFRGARSVINGMATFFLACNRHRLSTYNHVQAFFQRVANLGHITPHACRFQRAHQSAHQNEEERMECDRCK